jgi:hypothetical protein
MLNAMLTSDMGCRGECSVVIEGLCCGYLSHDVRQILSKYSGKTDIAQYLNRISIQIRE